MIDDDVELGDGEVAAQQAMMLRDDYGPIGDTLWPQAASWSSLLFVMAHKTTGLKQHLAIECIGHYGAVYIVLHHPYIRTQQH